MACETCTQTKPMLRCVGKLKLGNYDTTGTSLWVYIQNLATGKIHRVSDITEAAGLIHFTVGFSFTPNTTYKVWLNEESETMEEQKQWTFPDGTTLASCALMTFKEVYDGSARASETNAELQAA